MNLNTKILQKTKKAFYNIKVSTHQEYIIILNKYVPSNWVSKDMKQKLTELTYFNAPFSVVERIKRF